MTTILLVEDDERVRGATARMLEILGWRVVIATNGTEAIAQFQRQMDEITCVLLDLAMPEVSGEQVFDQLCRLNPQIRVIIMSGYSQGEAVNRLGGLGASGFLQKPFTFSELRDMLDRCCGA